MRHQTITITPRIF